MQRETAQYNVSEETGKEASARVLKDAQEFVNRIDKLITDLKNSDGLDL